ncbi:hypothetical protein [Novipirellula artificiosorum]|uniref:Outer membrane efflux protein n=1 Tax=Novipirellula artificiosorum TaxID=2528016 RepID=A0A5C6DXC8_9BACT|nr:hypothetical protein [Novipirellula artificiosorum]TWU39676.1 hypothetical protein Poly41_25320 [Novipirellula artificiosorum]
MSSLSRLAIAIVCFALIFPSKSASAQRGQLIEGLFRTLAETQLERERIKRMEAEKRADGQTPTPAKDPYRVQLPSGFGTTPAFSGPGTNIRPPVDRKQLSINVRSREAAQYAENLVRFNQRFSPLVSELRSEAAAHPEIRGLLSEAYAIAADGNALLERCDGLSSLTPIVDPYRELDTRYRQFSFNLQRISGLSHQCTAAIEQCDELCGLMGAQLNIQPQYDRHALHDVMLKACTYMQALEDDLQIAVVSQHECRQLTHDLRLLRQQLVNEAGRVDQSSYDEIVDRFTEMVGQWRSFSGRVYAQNNPHLARRLDRISECGEETYHLLRIQPPISQDDLLASGHRLHQSMESVLEQLDFRSLVRLKPEEQLRVLESTRDLYHQSERFHTLCEKRGDRNQMRDVFAQIDQSWGSLSESLQQIPSLNRGTIAEIDRACQQLRSDFGIEGIHAPTSSLGNLVQAAAALEGTAEYLDEQLNRYQKSIRPSSYRDSLRGAASDLYLHSKRLHEALDTRGRLNDQRFLGKLQDEAEDLVEAWNQLSNDLEHIDGHGLSSFEASRLKSVQRQAVPYVAEIAAALLQ